MTPLRQRYIEDMWLRGLAPTTQRSYLHYVAAATQGRVARSRADGRRPGVNLKLRRRVLAESAQVILDDGIAAGALTVAR